MNILKDCRSTLKKVEIKQNSVSLDGDEISFFDQETISPRVGVASSIVDEIRADYGDAVSYLQPQIMTTLRIVRGSWCRRLNTAIERGQSRPFNLSYAMPNWIAHRRRCSYCRNRMNSLLPERQVRMRVMPDLSQVLAVEAV